jgi:LysR family glycine cleavage system transcriptional activator
LNRTRPLVGLPTLTWLRAFEAAARTSSFTAAAHELRLTSGAISYQIRALEAHLGFALFERLPRGVRLTSMGVAYLPPVRRAFEQLADSTVGLFGGSERGEIAVHAPVSLASLWLAPKLTAFVEAHPSIDVRLSSVIWDNPGPDEATDLEIRYGSGHWRGYRAERLMNPRIVAVSSPQLLERTRSSGDAAGWLPQHIIHIMGHEDHWLQVRRALQLPADAAAAPGPIVDTTIAALELAAIGAGCALAHPVFLAGYLATGRLVKAMAREFEDESAYFVLVPERPQRMRREVERFHEWLIRTAGDCGETTPLERPAQ